MGKGDHLGAFEQLVLLSVIRLDDEAYGMRIRQELEECTGRSITIGAAYSTLERLEAKGFVASRRGESTPQRGGRAKRYFRLTASGATALNESRHAQERLGFPVPGVTT